MTHSLQIQGGAPLRGSVRISGAKNAALPIMAASMLTRDPCRLEDVPQLADVDNAIGILQSLGASVERGESGVLNLSAAAEIASEVPLVSAQLMRASILFMGPLLARTGRAVVPKPGGDDIGMRRVDQHVYGLEQLGAQISERDGQFVCEARHLHGADVQLDMPTVTGTENIMMAAAMAEGQTTISNAAREPHVSDLAAALNKMGARITGAGTDRIDIEGVAELGGYDHRVIPDYLEAGTYLIAAAATGGDVELLNCCPLDHVHALVLKLRQAGAEIEDHQGTMRIRREGELQPVDLITWTHPGFATDLQPQYTALMTQANGTAIIQEFLFDNRFQYVGELKAMGARIELFPHRRGIQVTGPSPLRGNIVRIPDIRAGAALMIAALCARGNTQLVDFEHLERGYEDIPGKLSGLGAPVREPAVRA